MEEKRTVYSKGFHPPDFLFKFLGIPLGTGRWGGVGGEASGQAGCSETKMFDIA
jgi:hypothetical protein